MWKRQRFDGSFGCCDDNSGGGIHGSSACGIDRGSSCVHRGGSGSLDGGRECGGGSVWFKVFV